MLKRRAAGAVNHLWLRPTALRLTLLHRGTGLHRISITHLHLSNRMLDQLLCHSFVEVRATRLGIRTAQQALRALCSGRHNRPPGSCLSVRGSLLSVASSPEGRKHDFIPLFAFFFSSPRAGQHRGVCQSKDGQNCPAPLNSADLSVFKREKGHLVRQAGDENRWGEFLAAGFHADMM